MDLTRASLLRELLSGSEFAARTSQFAHSMRRYTTRPSGLLLFGPPSDEPWHLTAHIDDEVRRAGLQELRPSLVRWSPAPDAPPHLRIGLDRLGDVGRGESLVVVSEDRPDATLLERVHDVRKRGATVFSIDNGDADLASVSHEQLVPGLLVPTSFGTSWPTWRSLTDEADLGSSQIDAGGIDQDEPLIGFEMAQHLVSIAVADEDVAPTGWRGRLRRLIERVGGETDDH